MSEETEVVVPDGYTEIVPGTYYDWAVGTTVSEAELPNEDDDNQDPPSNED